MEIIELLATAVKNGGSDIIFSVGIPPMIRYRGDLQPYGEEILTPELSKRMIYALLDDEQKAKFEETLELDLSISIKNVGRFRINAYRQQGYVGAAFRTIMSKIPSIDTLGLPPVVHEFANYPRGLVLVTGPTGSGKSTTLAAVIDKVNKERRAHIVTIEDPIEFVHPHKQSCVDQREVGNDTLSFANALKYVLRQDPDVILVGEMRDLETIAAAITLAETGHLVFSTLHTQSAAQTVDRIVDVFPPYQQQQVRVQLSMSLKAVVSQQLLPAAGGKGRVAAREIMLMTPAVANLIREGKTHMITNVIQTSRRDGMISMDGSLKELMQNGLVDPQVAIAKMQSGSGL
ncbi:MAG: type IV pilus twitching motility protein PilT [Candidatus Wallbacteria bacterium]|nr:type IV pilus twitching motility protein PilT [Candidatus Wallbacteria bacterium]MBI4867680.1 type IV pilus twitching motility protein PilT [Candidatus Wallbacteria bacterium]